MKNQKVITQRRPAREVCAPSAHTLSSQDTAVLRLSGLWYDFSTFLGVPAGTPQIGMTFSSMVRLQHRTVVGPPSVASNFFWSGGYLPRMAFLPPPPFLVAFCGSRPVDVKR